MAATRTSRTHPLRIDEVTAGEAGGIIGITFCPGRCEVGTFDFRWDRDLTADLDVVMRWNPDAIVTLIERHEFGMLGVPRLGEQIVARGIDWHHLPIADVRPPDERFEAAWRTSGPLLNRLLRQGGRVLVHCRAGLGRAGTVAARLLVELGTPARDAVRRVRQARPGAIETDAQLRYVLALDGRGCRLRAYGNPVRATLGASETRPQPMSTLASFPITRKWPARHPDRIQLYSWPTPNGVKASIMLEETGLPYEPHPVRFETNDQTSPEFLSLNPNNKIPAIIDPDGPNGEPMPLFESGAILIYLSEKCAGLGRESFMPADPAARYETIQWLMFQMGGIGPMFGQLGFFHRFAGKDYEDKRPRDRYANESKRLLGVLEQRLKGRAWIMGDEYTIADIAIFPWVRNLVGFYGAGDLVGFDGFPEVTRVLATFVERPAVARGLTIPG